MKSKKFLSTFLSITTALSMLPSHISAANNVNVNFTAQENGKFLCAPQFNVTVSSDTAENYELHDDVANGVSALDVLVKLHEIKYGSNLTSSNIAKYLEFDEYGYISKLFETETFANGFILNGAYPNNGTESPSGGYNGTTVTTQEISNNDTLEFFVYQDADSWSDELAWFSYKGNDINEITVAPSSDVELTLKSSSYLMAYQYLNTEEIHAVGSAVGGAQAAYVNTQNGELTNIDDAVTDAGGKLLFTAPEEGTYYLTSYIPENTASNPLIMSLTKMTVSSDVPEEDNCALTALSVTTLDKNPNALMLTPQFSSTITEYSTPVCDFPSSDMDIYRSAFIKATAVSKNAVITAECNGVSANITSGDLYWKSLNSALIAGKNNTITVTVAESDVEYAKTKVYSVKLPMKPKNNTPPVASVSTATAVISLDKAYTIDLSEIFSDSDEVDTLSYSVSIDGAQAVAAKKDYSFTPTAIGEHTLVFTANDGTATSAPYTVSLTVATQAPTSLTIKHNAQNSLPDGRIIFCNGDKFKLTAYDQDGNETPVSWKNSSWGTTFVLDEETGEVSVASDVYSSSTSYLYFTATSLLDSSVSKEIRIQATGIALSTYKKNQTVALSTDGQSAKTATVSGGFKDYNIWSYDTPSGVATLAQDPGNGNSIKFNLLRPGTITASFKLNFNEALTDTAQITVTGVAVENSKGENGKTYLGISTAAPRPTEQLTAYVAEGRSVSEWSSSDESIATVDENGLVTAKGIGSVIITATDSEGAKGGIKVVVESEEIPYFENLQFSSNAIRDYSTKYVFSPTVTDYSLEIKAYSTKNLILQNTTLFDNEKYNAVAEYTDADAKKQQVTVKSGAITTLENVPFDESKVLITLSDKNNPNNKTVYSFTVTRPRDSGKNIKSNGIVLVPEGRSLMSAKYNGYAEGTMFKLTENGEFKTSWGTSLDTGVSGTHYSYKCFTLGELNDFSLTITGNTVYEHLHYSVGDDGWIELPQGGGTTKKLSFGDKTALTVKIQIIDDVAYHNNIISGHDGFFDCAPSEYTLIIEKAGVNPENAQILTATTDSGDWYPSEFNSEKYTYCIVVPKNTTEKTLTYTIPDGASAKIGSTIQAPNEDGAYTLSLTTSQKAITVTSSDGNITNTYNFKIQKQVDRYPDKIVDFLCINSQYTNGIGSGYAAVPWVSLSGGFTSIGNFGGYITYYYKDAITDNPNNKYGIDFYVYGNANKDDTTSTKTSFLEPAQAWVSEDGEEWYALAGSAHYDDGVDWNYTVTYKKTANGKTAWSDNHGNSHSGSSYSGQYPLSNIYSMNRLSESDTIKLSGIVLPSRNGDIATVGVQTDAYPVKWGYADCFVNGTKGTDVNPYTDNSNFDLKTNGFDLKWAVDQNGDLVNVSDKEFHYVKLVSASNIWHPSFAEKSPEISGMMITKPQAEAVGTTSEPESITISDGAEAKVIALKKGQQSYSIDIGDMKYVSVSVNGAAEDDNIYINNTRTSNNEAVSGFKVTKEVGERKIRILVQNGDKEPLIYLLKVTGDATESNDLVEGIKLGVNGISRNCSTSNGEVYTDSVGYRISTIGIHPVFAENINVTVNGEAIKEQYTLTSGENLFTITGTKGDITHTVTLKITKAAPPASNGKISVYFTLLGDTPHGDGDNIHTLKKGGLKTWIPETLTEVDTPATVIDVFEKALDGKFSFVNADGNYISEIDGLAEFANGAYSGWMYTLNGNHPNKGVAEQVVRDGDKIIFHYTDNYTEEQGSEKWNMNSSSTSSSKNDNENDADKTEIDKNTPSTDNNSSGTNFLGDLPFKDVLNHWAYEAIEYAYNNALMNGTSNVTFSPDDNVTRAMLVTVLYRIENPTATFKAHSFTDVKQDEWYSDAIAWAVENGIVNGISDTIFAPNDCITREQAAAMIYRYAKLKELVDEDSYELSGFCDTAEISDWAVNALSWAYATGIMQGIDNSHLSPKGYATRAQIATILMRFCKTK